MPSAGVNLLASTRGTDVAIKSASCPKGTSVVLSLLAEHAYYGASALAETLICLVVIYKTLLMLSAFPTDYKCLIFISEV